tara:strand:+ start:1578 stop:2069 length:492 start_codon:yes stop_codon:yes gene_type:complete
MKLIMENWRKFTNEAHNYPHNLELKRKRCEGKPKTGDCAPNPPDEEAKKRIAQNEEVDEALTEEEEQAIELDEKKKKKKKKACKPSKGKRFAKRVNGKCRSYGQKGKAKDGGDRIRPGTKKGDAYCARSAKIKKCKNPPCANTLSRKKWKCRGSKSMKEGAEE